jgi:integrase
LAYAAALNGETTAKARPPTKPVEGSFGEMVQKYLAFVAKDPTVAEGSRNIYRRDLNSLCNEQARPDNPKLVRDIGIQEFDTRAIQILLDRRTDKPSRKQSLRSTLMRLFKWAKPRGFIMVNPVKETETAKYKAKGHATWTLDEIKRFAETYPLGTKEYLALVLFLLTGGRTSDVCRFGPHSILDHIGPDGAPYRAIRFTEKKGELRMNKQTVIPVHPDLQPALDLVPASQNTFLLNEWGRPFSAKTLGDWFVRKAKAAGLKRLSAHGLRKALLTISADSGATNLELMAMGGHTRPQTTMIYIEKRDREKAASAGMSKVPTGLFGNKIVSPAKWKE